MAHPAQLLSDPRRPYVPQGTSADPASTPNPTPETRDPLTPFDPPANLIPKIIRELADPTLSLAMTARNFSTDLDALCVWMTRQDIAQRIFITESAFAVKTRLAASSNMAMVAQTCQAIIHEFHDDQHHMNFKPQDPKGHEVKRRNRETSMRAGRLLLRLSKYVPMSPAAVTRAASAERASRVSERSNTQSHKPSKPAPPRELLALLNNPALATALAASIAVQLQAQSAHAGAAPPATPPAPNPSPSQISNSTSEILPTVPTSDPAPQSEIPNPQSEIPPSPAQRSKQAHPNTARETPVPLTISAHPVLAAAGYPRARAP